MEQMSMIPKESFTVKETAKIMSTSPHVVRNLLKTGELKAIKFGTLSIPMFEIRRFMQEAVSTQTDYKEFSDPDMLKKKKNNVYQMK